MSGSGTNWLEEMLILSCVSSVPYIDNMITGDICDNSAQVIIADVPHTKPVQKNASAATATTEST